MDKNVMIRVEGLGKRYVLGRNRSSGRYTALRDVLAEAVKTPLRRLRHKRSDQAQKEEGEFWALRDVNLEVCSGEVVGIIGRNGAGKSTLLKILSRITEPTTGRVSLRGRVASLLEVGTGFHPELTGRENISLNGAILGMSRVEIKAKFDEIVAFAEVERFLDTPVKRYSSGMYVRLAFAVAAHLEPEILIVDEVLAVGDVEFQKKCLGKMDRVAKAGRTVLFVGHNMNAIRSLCTRGVYLERGSVKMSGPIGECISHYLSASQTNNDLREAAETITRPTVTQLSVDPEALAAGDFKLDIELRSPFEIKPLIFGIVIYNEAGVPVYGSSLLSHPAEALNQPMQNGWIRLELAGVPLQTGHYTASIFLGDGTLHYVTLEHALRFFFVSAAPPARLLSFDSNGSLNWPAKWSRRASA